MQEVVDGGRERLIRCGVAGRTKRLLLVIRFRKFVRRAASLSKIKGDVSLSVLLYWPQIDLFTVGCFTPK